jgi:hypothetical protein
MRGRGPGPKDRELFSPARVPALRSAADDLSWLLTRGYADRSALKLVGDRHALTERQRMAVSRSSCSDHARESRRAKKVERVDGEIVWVDGFNVLIVIESAMSGGLILVGRDGAHRDLASVHGTWRKVTRTDDALHAIGAALAPAREVVVILDRPVSNSGRLAARMREVAGANAWPWTVELSMHADRELAASGAIVATGDARILDACAQWIDVPGAVVAGMGEAWIVDLSS